MTDNNYRLTVTVTVSVTVSKGTYGYDRQFEREFTITAPIQVMRQLEIAQSVDKLYKATLVDLLEQQEAA